MVFANRQQAAIQLVLRLEQYRGKNPLVLAIPRGAVPMSEVIVNSLGGELDILLSTKVTTHDNPELALGAVSESGYVYLDDRQPPEGFTQTELEKLSREATKRLEKKRRLFAPLVSPADPKDRIVIVVDDGIATGATMFAAVKALRAQSPKRIIVASPVASRDAVQKLQSEVDEVVVLHTPQNFYAVSRFYDDFSEVNDTDVIHVLSESRKKSPLRNANQKGTVQPL